MNAVQPSETTINLLHIEDNSADVRIVKEFLLTTNAKFTLVHSSDLKTAIEYIKTTRFDAILADMGLPDCQGLETLRIILEQNAKVPVIIMTGLDDEVLALQALKEGAADYLVKNLLNSESIIRTIRYSIERYKLIDELNELNQELEQKVRDRTEDLARANNSLELELRERRKNELELQRMNRALMAHGKSSLAMLYASEEMSYMQKVCDIIIEYCQYSMVWIGFAMNDDAKTVKPMVSSGFDEGYLESLKISWNEDNVRGRGPTGIAIRSRKPFICRNMLIDPSFELWRDEAIRRGYRASIVLPLNIADTVLGALNIYSTEPDPFTENEVQLLTELANDLAQGINTIHLRAERQKAEEQLQKYAADLKDLNATKDKFFSIIAHDLKNPFTSLLGASELLYSNAQKYNVEKIQMLSHVLNDSAKNGYDLLENLLEWARTQTGNIDFNPNLMSIKEIVEKNIKNLKHTASLKKIELHMEIDDDIQIHADHNMLNTIIRNLLVNAIKFTPDEGKVTINVVNQNFNIVFTIKDTGIGIEEQDIDKLFRIDKKMYRLGTAKERGTGLGLLLCKEFVEKHDGNIWVESEYGKGSEFKFSFPIKKL